MLKKSLSWILTLALLMSSVSGLLAFNVAAEGEEPYTQDDVNNAVDAINNAQNALEFADGEVARIDYSGETVAKVGMDETSRHANATVEEVDGKNALVIDKSKVGDGWVVGYDVSKDLIGQDDSDITVFVEYKLVDNTSAHTRFRINYRTPEGHKDSPWYIGAGHHWPFVDFDNFSGGDIQYGPYVRNTWAVMAFRVPNAQFQDAVGTMDFQFGSWIIGDTGILYIRSIKVVKTADLPEINSAAILSFVGPIAELTNPLYPEYEFDSYRMSWQPEGTINVDENGASGDGYIICPLLVAPESFGPVVKIRVTFTTPPESGQFNLQYNRTGARDPEADNSVKFHGVKVPVTDNVGEIVLTDAEFANKANGGSFRINELNNGVVAKVEVFEPSDADKTELQAAIAEANAKKAEEGYGKYSETTRTAFEAALAEAETVLADQFATQDAVDEATDNLTNAINALIVGGEISIDFSVEGYEVSGNFDITEDHSKANGFNFVDVGDGEGTKAYRLYHHNQGFAMKPKAGVFDDKDFLQIQIEYYWPNDKTQDNSRIHAESSGAHNWFTMRKVEIPGSMIAPAAFDSWETYTSDYVIRGEAVNQYGLKLMFWENSEAEKDDESVFIKSIKVIKVAPPPADKGELQLLYDNRQNTNFFTEESRADYQAALDQAEAVLNDPDATWDDVDKAIEDIINAGAQLVVRDDIYTTQNTTWDKHEFAKQGQTYSGKLVVYQGYYAWEMPIGSGRFIGIGDPDGILDGINNIVFEYEYYIPAGASANSRFFAGHGTIEKYINVSEPENGYSVGGGGHFKQAEVGKWATLKLELDNADTTKREDGMIMRFGWWGDGQDKAYVKGLRAYAVDEEGKMVEGKIVELVFNEAPIDKTALKAELDLKPEDGELIYTEESWEAYMEVWNAANAVYEDPEADQETVDNHTNLLSAAFQALVKVKKVLIDLTAGELEAINCTVSRDEGEFVDVEGIGKAYKMFEHNKGIQIKVDENLFGAADKVKIKVEYYFPDSTTFDNTRLGIQASGKNYILRKKDFNGDDNNFYTAAEVDKWAEYVTREIDAADINGQDVLFLFWENTGDNPGYYYIRKITIEVAEEEPVPTVDKTALKAELDKKPENGEEIYTKASWEAYMAKWNAGDTVYKDENATQAQVDTAKNELAAAFDALEEKELGDIDGDGKYSTTDARLALQAAVEKITLSEDLAAIADVDKDGKVTTTDARLLLQLAVNKIDKLPGAEA